MTALYICYQSIQEPLTSTQVVAYLEGLARADYVIILLTFEPRRLTSTEEEDWQNRMMKKGIHWTWLRYHKWPSVPATAWDVLAGIVTGLRLIRKHHVRLIHARTHVPGLMALVLKRFTRAKMLFDVRGFMAEEYVDAGVWPEGGMLFRITKRVERRLVRAADALVVLTARAHELLQAWYPQEIRDKPIQIIPCCVDLRAFPAPATLPGGELETIVYVGKLGGWYLTESMTEFVAAAMRLRPGLRWEVLTQSDPAPFRELASRLGIGERVTVGRVSPEAIADRIRHARAGLSFVKPCLSKLASSPTKVAEYLAAGVPVVATAGVGDMDHWLADPRCPVGLLVPASDPTNRNEAITQFVELLTDPNIRRRCRQVAEERFDLEQVGWARYREIYRAVLGSTEVR